MLQRRLNTGWAYFLNPGCQAEEPNTNQYKIFRIFSQCKASLVYLRKSVSVNYGSDIRVNEKPNFKYMFCHVLTFNHSVYVAITEPIIVDEFLASGGFE